MAYLRPEAVGAASPSVQTHRLRGYSKTTEGQSLEVLISLRNQLLISTLNGHGNRGSVLTWPRGEDTTDCLTRGEICGNLEYPSRLLILHLATARWSGRGCKGHRVAALDCFQPVVKGYLLDIRRHFSSPHLGATVFEGVNLIPRERLT